MSGEVNREITGAVAEGRTAARRRSGIRIMGQLIGPVRPLLPVMLLAIVLGTVGDLCAIFLMLLVGYGLMHTLLAAAMEAMGSGTEVSGTGLFLGMETGALFLVPAVMAVMRRILHHGEQYCNHFIAFKLLAIIRHKIFAALRKLCTAKLEGIDNRRLS